MTWLAPASRAAARSALSLSAVNTMIGSVSAPGHGADPAAQVDAVDAGHHHVEDGQVGQAEAEHPDRFLAAAGGDHLELLDLEVEADDVNQAGVVVHEEHARPAGAVLRHRAILRRPAGAGTRLVPGSNAPVADP